MITQLVECYTFNVDFTDLKSVLQRSFTLKKNDTKKTDLSLSVKKELVFKFYTYEVT